MIPSSCVCMIEDNHVCIVLVFIEVFPYQPTHLMGLLLLVLLNMVQTWLTFVTALYRTCPHNPSII